MQRQNLIAQKTRSIKILIFTALVLLNCNESAKKTNAKPDSQKEINTITTEFSDKLANQLKDIHRSTREISLARCSIDQLFPEDTFYSNIKHISLTFCKINSIDSLIQEIAHKSDITLLELYECEFDADAINLTALKSLKTLKLVIKPNTQLKFNHDVFNDSLTELVLGNTPINTKTTNIISNVKSLEKLTLMNCQLKNINPAIFKLPNIKHLNLQNNQINHIDFKTISSSVLLELNIYDNPMADLILANIKQFESSINYSNFKRNFPKCQLTYTLDLACGFNSQKGSQ